MILRRYVQTNPVAAVEKRNLEFPAEIVAYPGNLLPGCGAGKFPVVGVPLQIGLRSGLPIFCRLQTGELFRIDQRGICACLVNGDGHIPGMGSVATVDL